jgi:hypothetical protein
VLAGSGGKWLSSRVPGSSLTHSSGAISRGLGHIRATDPAVRVVRLVAGADHARGKASEPVRVVVTLTQAEFSRIEKGAPGRNVADFLRVAGVAVADFQAKEKLSPS